MNDKTNLTLYKSTVMRKLLHFSAVLFLFLLVPASITRAQNITSLKGLKTIELNLPAGVIKIYLPDDIRPGDMISGSVKLEPAGNTDRQRQKALDDLLQRELKIGDPNDPNQVAQSLLKRYQSDPRAVAIQLEARSLPFISSVTVTNKGKVEFSIPLELQNVKPGNTSPPSSCTWPTHAMTGSPLRISGPFDGNAENTRCRVGSQQAIILAESPGNCFIQMPGNSKELQEMQVNENNAQSCSGNIQGVDMQVSAGRLSLNKGEGTYVDVSITGLQQLQDNATLTVMNNSASVVAMSPSNHVITVLYPDSVAGGTYQQRYNIRSLMTGNFSVTVDLDLPEPPLIFYENKKSGEANKQDTVPCHPTPEEAAKAAEAVKALEDELSGIDARIREVSIAGIDCKEALDKLADEYNAAKKAFGVQETRKKQYDLNPQLFTAEQKKAMQKDYDDAKAAMDEALKKWREQNEQCKKLAEELNKLKERKKSLPGLIKDATATAEKTKAEAEKCRQKEEEEKKKKKEEEDRKKTGAQPGDNGGVKPGEETTSPAGKPCQPEGSKMKTNERIYEPCEVEETVITPCNVSEFQSAVLDKIKDLLNMIKKLKDPIELAEKIAKVSSLSKAICINVHIIRKWKDVEHTWECVNGKWVEVNTKTTNNGVDKYGSFQVMDGSLKCCWVFDGSKAMEAEVANKIQERLDQCK